MAETRVIVAGSLIDGSGAGVQRHVFLAVANGLITGLGAAADLPHHHPDPITDLSHCVILPPLVDCSVTLTRSPAVGVVERATTTSADPAARRATAARHSRYCHSYGVLGVAASDDLTGLLASERNGLITLRTAGNGSPGDFLRLGYGPELSAAAAPAPRLNRPELARLLAGRGGRKAVVVANGRQPVAEALAAGCDAIEQGYGMGEDNLRRMAAERVLWLPSLLRAKNAQDSAGSGGEVCCRFSQRYVAPGKADPTAEAFWQKRLAEQLAQLALARELGVMTAVGTGAGGVGILHGESMVEEMKLFLRAGYSLAETVRCASENGARFFGMTELGALAVGRPATFLLARGSVQQLPRKLSYLEGIYINGEPSPNYRKNPVRS